MILRIFSGCRTGNLKCGRGHLSQSRACGDQPRPTKKSETWPLTITICKASPRSIGLPETTMSERWVCFRRQSVSIPNSLSHMPSSHIGIVELRKSSGWDDDPGQEKREAERLGASRNGDSIAMAHAFSPMSGSRWLGDFSVARRAQT